MPEPINTHNLTIDFGKHRGERWTRLPVSYLFWLVNEVGGEKGLIAQAELDRRGTTMPTDLEVSGHALDRASQVVPIGVWKKQGIHAWLSGRANEALKIADGKEEVVLGRLKYCFVYGEHYPTLKTVIHL